MRNEIERLHVSISGDSTTAARYLPFAKSKLRDLLILSGGYGRYAQAQRYTPVTGVTIAVRVVGEDRWIHIEALPPCVDNRGFLLSVKGQQQYSAFYNDGVIEAITTDKKTAVRTKGVRLPQELQYGGFDNKQASRFTGLMREAVGCYHSANKNSPFSYTFGITHGIVRKTAVINNQTVVKHWVVEISVMGVYAAPIVAGDRCCDAWDVTQYLPSKEIRKLNPEMEILSLASGYNLHKKGITQIVSQGNMTAIYGDGDGWYDGQGWAFSASGGECQNIFADLISLPVQHFLMTRWKIVFNTDPLLETLTAAAVAMTRKGVFAPETGQTLWTPFELGRWEGMDCRNSPPPVTYFPSQAADVHVFYAGETERVTRWTMSFSSIGDTDINDTGTDEVRIWPAGCYGIRVGDSYTFHSGDGSRTIIPAHSTRIGGYSGSGFNHVRENSTYLLGDRHYINGPSFSTEESYSNFFGLDPSCYYICGDPPALVTTETCQFTQTDTYQTKAEVNSSSTETRAGASILVLLAEEREAIVALATIQSESTGSMNTAWVWSIRTNQTVEPHPTGECGHRICYGWNFNPGGSGGLGPMATVPPEDTAFDNISRVAQGTLAIGGVTHSVVIPMDQETGPGPVLNDNLADFYSFNPASKPYASSPIYGMHGNLNFPEPKLTPPDQTGNVVYLFEGPQQFISPAFAHPPYPLAFVGKA